MKVVNRKEVMARQYPREDYVILSGVLGDSAILYCPLIKSIKVHEIVTATCPSGVEFLARK